MERWAKVLLGTFFSSIGCLIFFLIYDRIQVYFRQRRHVKQTKTFPMKQVYRSEKKAEKNEGEGDGLNNPLLDDYDTYKHEVLCVCMESEKRGTALCILLADREIEWYSEEFPDCCVEKSGKEDYRFRNVLAAVSRWAEKWTMSETVNLLCQDGDLVRSVAKGTTREYRSFYQYEKRNSFRLFLQWTENFMCGEVADEELWEDAILVTKALHANADPAAIEDLPLVGWKIKRVKPANESYHMVPHPGDVTPVAEEEEEVFEEGRGSTTSWTESSARLGSTGSRLASTAASKLGSTGGRGSRGSRLTSTNSRMDSSSSWMGEKTLDSPAVLEADTDLMVFNS